MVVFKDARVSVAFCLLLFCFAISFLLSCVASCVVVFCGAEIVFVKVYFRVFDFVRVCSCVPEI